jgi:hypothetical protein
LEAAPLPEARETDWLEESISIADGDEPEGTSAREGGAEQDDRPRRRRSDRRRGAVKERASRRRKAAGKESDAPRADDSQEPDLHPDNAQQADSEPLPADPTAKPAASKPGHKNIPSWDEAIRGIVEVNLTNRASSPRRSQRGGRGRSRGRSRRK